MVPELITNEERWMERKGKNPIREKKWKRRSHCWLWGRNHPRGAAYLSFFFLCHFIWLPQVNFSFINQSVDVETSFFVCFAFLGWFFLLAAAAWLRHRCVRVCVCARRRGFWPLDIYLIFFCCQLWLLAFDKVHATCCGPTQSPPPFPLPKTFSLDFISKFPTHRAKEREKKKEKCLSRFIIIITSWVFSFLCVFSFPFIVIWLRVRVSP